MKPALHKRGSLPARFARTSARRTGFTLIELLVVIAIIAILTVVGITLFRSVTGGARDARRQTDVDSIAKTFEVKAAAGKYNPSADSDFASGKPKDPVPAKGEYFTYLASDGSGYKICASLENNPSSYCNTPATNCYCKFSSQSTISSSSTADPSSTNYGSGPGGSSQSSCDTNGSLTTGLVGYWKMDEDMWNGTAGEVKDSSGMNINGTAGNGANTTTDASHNPSVFNNVGYFNGSSWTDFPPSGIYALTNDITISMWVKPASLGQSADLVYRHGTSRSYDTKLSGGRPVLRLSPDGTGEGGTGNNAKSITGNTALTVAWHHIAFTYDMSEMKVYVDGNSDATPFAYTNPINQAPGDYLSMASQWSTGWFNGYLDDVRIYDRALLPEEIEDLHNNGNGCTP